jgi:hypothetical protein
VSADQLSVRKGEVHLVAGVECNVDVKHRVLLLAFRNRPHQYLKLCDFVRIFFGQVGCLAKIRLQIIELFDFLAIIVFEKLRGNSLVLGLEVFPFSLTNAIALLIIISVASARFALAKQKTSLVDSVYDSIIGNFETCQVGVTGSGQGPYS